MKAPPTHSLQMQAVTVVALDLALIVLDLQANPDHFLGFSGISEGCEYCWIMAATLVWMACIAVTHEGNKRRGIHG